jgi:hypothetical protein
MLGVEEFLRDLGELLDLSILYGQPDRSWWSSTCLNNRVGLSRLARPTRQDIGGTFRSPERTFALKMNPPERTFALKMNPPERTFALNTISWWNPEVVPHLFVNDSRLFHEKNNK